MKKSFINVILAKFCWIWGPIFSIKYNQVGADKPFKCSFCAKSYARKGHLTLHERTHQIPAPPETDSGILEITLMATKEDFPSPDAYKCIEIIRFKPFLPQKTSFGRIQNQWIIVYLTFQVLWIFVTKTLIFIL